nr:CHASE domain-containing protein [uncultured Roseateles sp.]
MKFGQTARGAAIAMTAAALMLGLALTATAVFWVTERGAAEAQIQFDRHAERIEAEIVRRFSLPVYGLKGARGVYAAYSGISKAQFQAYVESRNLPVEFPGVRGFGFIQRVMRPDLERFTASVQADGAPGFVVTTSGQAEELYVIRFIEPLRDNVVALGFDVGSEPVRRRAIERAVDTGEPVLSEKLNLVQDRSSAAGFLYVVPVFRVGANPTRPEQRRAALVGLLYAPIVARELLAGVADIADRELDIQLRLGDGSDIDQQVFDAGLDGAGSADRSGISVSRHLVIGGRPMTLQLSAAPTFTSGRQGRAAAYVAAGGALLSLLLALSVWLLAAGRLRAESMARRMTLDLARLAQVVRSTSNAVMITDCDLRINWINEGFTRISGYGAAEAQGRTPGELLGSGKADRAVLQRLADAAAAGEPCRVEILNRAKDGREYWIDTEIQPLHDAQGQLTGFMEIGSDVTAQKAAAAELAHERQRLEYILRGTRVGTWERVEPTRLTEVNERWAEMLGYTREELGPITDAAWSALAHPDDLQRSNLALERHFAGDIDHYECEIRLRHKNGRWVWVLSRGQVFQRDAGGQVERMAGTHMDITARKQAEEELTQANAMLQAILDNLPCGLSVFDADLQMLAHTRQFRSLLDLPDHLFGPGGTSFESIIRWNAERGEYGPGEIDTIVAQRVAYARQPTAHQFERQRPDGTTLDIRGAPLPSGGFVTTYTDITDRKRAEEVVRDSAHLMRLVTDNIPARIAYWDTEMHLKFANKAFFERYGGDVSTRAGHTAGEVLGQDRVDAAGPLIEAARRGEPQSLEREEWSDGEPVHSLTHLIPGWRDGKVEGVVALTMDISFVKRAEADLRLANYALEVERDRAEQASLAKGQFVANMSHEIRTPMNAILGMLKLLGRTALTPRQRDYASKTERAARALLGLLNDILDFSKVEAGKMGLDPQPFAVNGLLADLSVILSSTLGDKPVELRFEVDPELPPWLVGDAMRLQQVLVNLAGNAIKFTAAGEVVLRLRLVERKADTCRLEFAVRDTGIGIAPEQQEQIFSSFSQAEASTTRRFGGTGLGLSISQRLVELMGGRIELDSRQGQGSTFRFTIGLPVAEAEPADVHEAGPSFNGQAPGQQRLQGLRLLLVEDNLNNQQVAQELLEAEGAAVVLASDGQQGVAAVADTEPGFDAVLMDVQMPVMDGFTATRLIRRQPGRDRLLIIAMTANASADDRAACLAAGMDEHVGKPFDIDGLVALLQRRIGLAPSPAAAASTPPPGLGETALAEARARGLDLDAALARIGGRTDVWARSAKNFLLRLDTVADELAASLESSQSAEVARLLHTLKGESAMLGASQLAALSAAAEQAFQGGAGSAVFQQSQAALTHQAAQTREHLAAVLQHYQMARPAGERPHGDADRAGLLHELGRLAALLADDDMAATDQFAALQQAHESHWADALAALGESVAALDFAQARLDCQALIRSVSNDE